MFQVGQKVVCVDAGENDDLIAGAHYTVTWSGIFKFLRIRPAVRLAETRHTFSNIPFFASRFRPLVERKTDISIFREILRKASNKQPLKVTP